MPEVKGMTLDLTGTNLYGQIGAIICWYLDDGNIPPSDLLPEDFEDEISLEEVETIQREMEREALEEQRRIGRLVGLIPEIVEGDFSKVSGDDLWDVWDALGSYPQRDETLNSIYACLGKEVSHRNKEEDD